MKRFAVIISLGLALVGCSRPSIRTGDLIFVGIPAKHHSTDTSSMANAISDATGTEEGINMVHVAIAEVEKDSIWIIDATIKHGVDRHPLDTFISDFTRHDGSLPSFEVMRVKGYGKKATEGFVQNAKQYLGCPYDNYFAADNDAYYCTELVRESYLDSKGGYIFSEKPMNFKDSLGNMPAYWERLFKKLGVPIPQGEMGTNPQDMSKEAVLEPVNVSLLETISRR